MRNLGNKNNNNNLSNQLLQNLLDTDTPRSVGCIFVVVKLTLLLLLYFFAKKKYLQKRNENFKQKL